MSSPTHNSRRALTSAESLVLKQIQDMYGAQNSEERVFFSDNNEAILFVTDVNGTAGLAAVLTNLARMLVDGSIASVDELRGKWLVPQ